MVALLYISWKFWSKEPSDGKIKKAKYNSKKTKYRV